MTQPWKDGKYKIVFNDKVYAIASVSGCNALLDNLDEEDNIEERTLKHGNFKETDPKNFNLTGKQNFEISLTDPSKPEDEEFGVLSEDFRTITFKAKLGMMYSMELIDVAEAIALKEKSDQEKDPADAPSNHYPLRPGHIGKLVFISGNPGFGKSTTARRMMDTKGFVYYEGDCFMSHKNPYLPPGNNSAIDALLLAKPLKGVPKERKEVVKSAMKEWEKIMAGNEEYQLEDFYAMMCEDILRERKRVGGDWVVAQAVPTRKLRDLIKSKLGPDLLFVVLNLDKDHHRERLEPRLPTFGEQFVDVFLNMKYELAEENEENVLDLKITRQMELDDVVEIIMKQYD